jgi:hypothetical protein
MRLTAAAVTALTLPVGKTDYIAWDDDLPGFGVRLRDGRKSYVCQYRIGTQQRRESLGDVRRIKLEDAKKIARQRFAQVELGTDPKVQAKGAATSLSLARVADRYLQARKDVSYACPSGADPRPAPCRCA